MDVSQVILYSGDPYRCERALREREEQILALDPACERYLRYGDELDLGDLEYELRSSSLFALGRHFVIRHVERNKQAKRLAPVVCQALPEGTFLTLLATELKATNAVYKACKQEGVVVALAAPRGRGISDAARQLLAECDLTATPTALRELITRCDSDLLDLSQEAKKLRTYAPAETPIQEDTMARLVFPRAEQSVYPFYDHLGARNLPAALADLKALRDDPGRILGGTVRHLTRLAMVRLLQEEKVRKDRAMALMGVADWLFGRLSSQARNFAFSELPALVEQGVLLDHKIKSGEIAALDALLELVFAATRTG